MLYDGCMYSNIPRYRSNFFLEKRPRQRTVGGMRHRLQRPRFPVCCSSAGNILLLPSLTPCIIMIKVLLNLKQMDFVLHYLDFSTFNTIEYDTCDAFIGLAMSVSVTEEPIDYRKRC